MYSILDKLISIMGRLSIMVGHITLIANKIGIEFLLKAIFIFFPTFYVPNKLRKVWFQKY